jgi:hypothetical protein
MRFAYLSVKESELPKGLRFDVPRREQGQIIEVAYADDPPEEGEACNGSKYRRESDQSDGSVTYYVRAT